MTANKTVTDARFKAALKNQVNPIINETVPPQIEEAVDKVTMKAGRMTKFYPYLDKAEVELYDSNRKVYCKILHKFFGELMDFYTPLAEEQTYCDVLHEPCIVPRLAVNCCVVNVKDGTDYWLLLGYFNNDEIVGLAPAEPGNVKFSYINGVNEFWLEFGRDGLECRLPSNPRLSSGVLDKDMVDVEYADKSEVYSKEEIDDIISHLPHGDMSDYVRKDRILLDYGVDFTYTLGVGAMNEDYITIEPFLIEKTGDD